MDIFHIPFYLFRIFDQKNGMNRMASVLIGMGLLLIFLGLLWWAFGGLFSWFGRLPGDIRIERGNFSLYFPLTSMLLISLILNLIVYLISKIFNG